MLRNTVLAAVVIALTPAIAIAAPSTAAKAAPAAMTSTVKAEKMTIVMHHAKVKKLKVTTKLQHKTKATIVKS
jgi:hypothetical protein